MTAPYPKHPQLTGNYAPLRMECDIEDVIVRGEIPRDLDITYYRNGPDPQFPPKGRHHWFVGDGMLHTFAIADGRVRYRNRWARTAKWRLEREAHRSLYNLFNPMENDPITRGVEEDGVANTNVVWHGDKLLALEEGHAPFEIDPQTLASIGPWRFGGKLQGPMTAHPKIDPKTGEMLFFGYMTDGLFSAGMAYHVVDAAGALVRSERFDAPFPSMVHDFIVTDEHVAFPIFPLTGSMERAMSGRPPFAWEPDKGTHIGVMRRNGGAATLRWFETDPCYVFHPMNAWTEGDRIVAHVMLYEQAPLFPNPDGAMPERGSAEARLCEWIIDLADNAGGVRRRYLDDVSGEFPRLDERFAGSGYRHGYYAASMGQAGGSNFNAVVHHDFVAGKRDAWVLPDGDVPGEPVFVPRARDAAEGDGYLLSVAYRGGEHRSDLVFLDAQRVADGPIACAELPHRVPFGFHGNWKPNA